MDTTIIFDFTYYALSMTIILILVYTIILGFRARHNLSDRTDRNRALGIVVAAFGFLISLVGGVSLDAMMRSGIIGDEVYQQAHFSIFYAGSGMILYGVIAAILSARGSDQFQGIAGRSTQIRILVWIPFMLAVLASASYLFNPSTYTITNSGNLQHVAQQLVYFLPLFVALMIGAVSLPIVASRSEDIALRGVVIWFGLSATMIFVGALREATIIPSSGNPLIDLLMSFVPFTLGGFCLCMSARTLPLKRKDSSILKTSQTS